MKLPFLEFGARDLPPVVLVHGLFGQGKNLAALGRALSEKHYVMAVDLRNHGGAGWSDEHSYEALGEDLFETFGHLGRIGVMGHSMGGKAAMMLALRHGDLVEALMVADMAPMRYGHSYDDMIEAMRAVDLGAIKTRRDADEQMKAMVPDAGMRAFLLHSLKTGDAPHWQNNIEVLAENMDQILGWPEVDARYEGRVLFLGGGKSDYISDAARPKIKALFPRAKIMSIKNAGHWLHIEEPEIFADITAHFFDGDS